MSFFEWDYSHLSSNNRLTAISQRRWVCQPPIRMYFTSSLSERCILISGRIVKKHICFVICKKGTFEWDYSHLFRNNRSRAISQRRWVWQPPTRMCFTSSLKERCILISGCIVKKYISFVICKKGSFEWDYPHLFSNNRLRVISQRRWVCQPLQECVSLVVWESTVCWFLGGL